jgi:hypothetical protein
VTIGLTYDDTLSRVQIALSGLPNGTVLVERSINELLWSSVRGGLTLPVSVGVASLDDFEFAADVENHYRVTILELEGPLMEKFETSGIWTKPLGLIAVRVRCVGDGGGGGGAATTAAGECASGGGGQGGYYAESIIAAASLGATETATVGGGGAGGTAGANNGDQGSSASFGSHVVAIGGSGGLGGTAGTPPASGTNAAPHAGAGSVGQIIASGGIGDRSERVSVSARGGSGGDAGGGMGAGARTNSLSANGNTPGEGYGGGGSGGNNSASQGTGRAGGAGRIGVVIVENIFWPPGA